MRSDRSDAGRDAFVLQRYAPFLLHTLANKISASSSRTYLDLFGVGLGEWRVLAQLDAGQVMTGQRIAALSSMDKAAVSRALRTLELSGYVVPVPNPRDGRERAFGLTEQGAAIRARITAEAITRERQLLDGLTLSERETLYSLLHRLLANVAMMSVLPPDAEPAPA